MDRPHDHRQELTLQPRSPSQMMENAMKSMFDGRRLRGVHLQLLVLGVALALVAVVSVFLAVKDDGGRRAILEPSAGAVLVSQAQLEQLAESVDHPVYWAGPREGFSYELTETADGRVFIRYLPAGVAAGDPRPDFLTVGTYSRPSAFAGLKGAAKREGSVSVNIADGGLAVFDSKKPTSVYFGYPGTKYQVEVFAPSGETARSLVLGGKIKPVD